jgi:two-component system cell cycle response regulator
MDRCRILIIDDDSTMRKTLADLLRIKGYETLVAKDGREGLALLDEQSVNLVLIDLGLPGLSGLEVLDRVKTEHAEMPAIILTGNASLDSAVEATNRGAFSYLLKPCDFEQLTLHIRLALEKKQAEAQILWHNLELQRMNAELKALYEVSQAIGRTLDMDQLISGILHALVQTKLFPFEIHGAIFLVEEGRIRLTSFASPTDTVVDPCKKILLGQCLCGEAVATEKVVFSPNVMEDGRNALCHPETSPHGRIVVPLKAVDKVVGLLSLYTHPGAKINDSQLKLFSALSSQIGIAIHNAKLYEETKSFSLRDPLTGLANRRFLEIELEKSFAAARRYGEGFAVIMLDIDNFKKYNDTFGHPAGDRLLAKLAEILLQGVRRADYVFRYGGEEFLIILPETDPAIAGEAAERLRRAVELETEVTISLGLASFQKGLPDKEALISQADSALYLAKQKGRNRVEGGVHS